MPVDMMDFFPYRVSMDVLTDVAGGYLVLRPLMKYQRFIGSRTFCGRGMNSRHQRDESGVSRDPRSGFSLLENLFLFFKNVFFSFLNCMYMSLSEHWLVHLSTAPAEARGGHWMSWGCRYRQLRFT